MGVFRIGGLFTQSPTIKPFVEDTMPLYCMHGLCSLILKGVPTKVFEGGFVSQGFCYIALRHALIALHSLTHCSLGLRIIMASQEFECIFCFETKCENNPHEVGEYLICVDCASEQIVPQFEKAVEFEFNYPVRCGGVVVDMLNFWDLVSNELFQRHAAKEEEYTTKVSDRIYCKHSILRTDVDDAAPINVTDVVGGIVVGVERCNEFLGSKCDGSMDLDPLHCRKCAGLVCRKCGDALDDAESMHDCVASTEMEPDAEFDGLKRGQDYQICGCTRRIELSEACNELDCPCGNRLCYRCGASTIDDPAHFALGGCPRWGSSDVARAEDFDQAVRTSGPFTVQEWNEAVRTARDDELAHPTHPLPEETLANFERNLRIIEDRNDVHAVVQELHQQLHLDYEENVEWRRDTFLLLGTVQLALNLLLSGGHAPAEDYTNYITAFEGYDALIREKKELVPAQYIAAQGYLFDVVPSVQAQMALMISEMRGEVEWGEFMIPF